MSCGSGSGSGNCKRDGHREAAGLLGYILSAEGEANYYR
jgi:hypothetical protein